MRNTIITIILCQFCLFVGAQNAPLSQVIEYDKKTGRFNSELPFDKSFYLKIKIDKSDIVKRVDYTNLPRPLRRSNVGDTVHYKRITFFEEPIKSDKENKYVVLQMPPLNPNGLYEIVMSKKFSGKVLHDLLKLMSLFDEGQGPKFDLLLQEERKLKKEYNQKHPQNEMFFPDSTILNEKLVELYLPFNKANKHYTNCSKLKSGLAASICIWDKKTVEIVKQYLKIAFSRCGDELNNCEGVLPYNLSTYYELYNKHLKSHYKDYNHIKVTRCDLSTLFKDNDFIAYLAQFFNNAVTTKRTKKRFETSLKLLSNFKSSDNKELHLRLNGHLKLTDFSSAKPLGKGDLVTIAKNLQANLDSLSKFREDIKIIRLFDSARDEELKNLMGEIDNVELIWKKKLDKIKSIIDLNLKFEANATEEVLLSHTYIDKISKEATNWILPDFGVLYGFDGDSDVLRPFLGANINFGPVDKNIRTRFMSSELAPGSSKIGRYIRHHFSLLVGVSFGTIKIENRREDLFNGINIFSGIGYRFTRSLRVSSGILWYNGVNPNPLLSDKKVEGMGYFSLSFDIEFKSASGSTLNKLF